MLIFPAMEYTVKILNSNDLVAKLDCIYVIILHAS